MKNRVFVQIIKTYYPMSYQLIIKQIITDDKQFKDKQTNKQKGKNF